MSTQKRIIFNLLERAVSADNDNLQAFAAYERDETLRALYDDKRWPIQFPGYSFPITSLTSPLTADVLSGLMVRVDVATDLLVDPGVLVAIVPALASAGDSLAVLVTDPGVQTTGVLPFVANTGLSVRLDIVECSVTDTLVTASTRDIYNPTTGLFVPTVVDKVRAPQLAYRIRQGVAGSGLPATASGWLPLAVVCHQPGTTSFANCDFWDVRPLVSDRAQFGNPQSTPGGLASRFESPVSGRWRSTVAGGISGFAWGQFDGYIAGGQLIASAAFPIADHGSLVERFDPTYGPNKVPSFALTADSICYLAAFFPGGLPRWVKYDDSASHGVAGTRVPEGPRGILAITNVQPSSAGYYTGQTLPVVSGFTAGAPGVALCALGINHAGTRLSGACVGNRVMFEADQIALPGIAGVGTNQVSWTFAALTSSAVPMNARAIDLTFVISTGTAGSADLFVKNTSGAENIFESFLPIVLNGGSASFTVRGIPLSTDLPWNADGGGTAAQTFVQLNTPAAMTAAVAHVVGYSL